LSGVRIPDASLKTEHFLIEVLFFVLLETLFL